MAGRRRCRLKEEEDVKFEECKRGILGCTDNEASSFCCQQL